MSTHRGHLEGAHVRSVAVLVSLALYASASQAQLVGAHAQRLTLALGPLVVSARDANASPLRYTGTGALVLAEYSTRTERQWLSLRAGGVVGTLRSVLGRGGQFPRELVHQGWLELEYKRGPAVRASRVGVYAGGLLSAHGTVVRHFYADFTDAGYAFYRVWLGPSVAVEGAVGGRGIVSARLAVPVLALVARPYANIRRQSVFLVPPDLSLQVATAAVFQAADLTVSYGPSQHKRLSIVLAYHLVVERYRDTQALRFALQGVTVAMSFRFGGPDESNAP